MCRRNHKGQQSLGLTFRHDVHIQHALFHDEVDPGMKQRFTFFRVLLFAHACLEQSIPLLERNIFLGAHPFAASSQYHILTLCFFPVGHVHGCQLEGAGSCFFIQVITFYSQGLANEDLSSFCCACYCSFQEQLYGILVMSDWYSA